jgi:hypothetical protein
MPQVGSVISVAKSTHSLNCTHRNPLRTSIFVSSLAASRPRCRQITQYSLLSDLRPLQVVRRTRDRTPSDFRKLKNGSIILRTPDNGIDFLPILLPWSSTPYIRIHAGLGKEHRGMECRLFRGLVVVCTRC